MMPRLRLITKIICISMIVTGALLTATALVYIFWAIAPFSENMKNIQKSCSTPGKHPFRFCNALRYQYASGSLAIIFSVSLIGISAYCLRTIDRHFRIYALLLDLVSVGFYLSGIAALYWYGKVQEFHLELQTQGYSTYKEEIRKLRMYPGIYIVTGRDNEYVNAIALMVGCLALIFGTFVGGAAIGTVILGLYS